MLHVIQPERTVGRSGDAAAGVDVRVGFVVSRSVGGSVVRNRVQRRLRAAVGPLVSGLPAGTRLVVRALPPAAAADFHTLDEDLSAALGRIGLATR